MIQLNFLAFIIVAGFFTFGPKKYRLPLWAAVILGLIPRLNFVIAFIIVAVLLTSFKRQAKTSDGDGERVTPAAAGPVPAACAPSTTGPRTAVFTWSDSA